MAIRQLTVWITRTRTQCLRYSCGSSSAEEAIDKTPVWLTGNDRETEREVGKGIKIKERRGRAGKQATTPQRWDEQWNSHPPGNLTAAERSQKAGMGFGRTRNNTRAGPPPNKARPRPPSPKQFPSFPDQDCHVLDTSGWVVQWSQSKGDEKKRERFHRHGRYRPSIVSYLRIMECAVVGEEGDPVAPSLSGDANWLRFQYRRQPLSGQVSGPKRQCSRVTNKEPCKVTRKGLPGIPQLVS
ncbi:hypothetical protein B0J18DRAFT_283262 [Chaetomium sp. MPI-SDFR-AT-0129]|nr:hypothetical protein B0J18DRAFT_283262 [Chaetomium sp. MPI-SDFR-AT-0129]